ncbi:MAG TPA: 7TM diverse intracellular signaling domain-containing protein [Puia sp.]|nr:7TM diverse intracellular signaling domain-containing protein [Puia sp.]
MKALVLGLLFLALYGAAGAQDPVDSIAADLAKTGLLSDLSSNTWIFFSDDKQLAPDQLPSLAYQKGTGKYVHFLAPRQVNRLVLLRFRLANSGDSSRTVFFCPGFLASDIRLYRLTGGSTEPRVAPVPRVLPDDGDSLGYRGITLAAHDTGTYYAALTFIQAASNSINPTVTQAPMIRDGIVLQRRNKTSIDIITNLFAGIMLMMIFYAFSEYIQSGKPEFLYYGGYSVCISVLLFLKSILHDRTTAFNFIFESFLDNIIFSAGYIFYIAFHRKFLETRALYRDLDRYLFWGTVGIGALTGAYVLSRFLSPDFRITNDLEVATKLFLLLISVIFIIKGLGYRNRLMSFIVMGNISLCLLSIVSQAMISLNIKIVNGVSVLNSALFYYEAGITIELLFFLFALSYKNKMEIILSTQKEEKLKLETERKEMEKQVAVLAAKQDERNRISVDMHDELGSGVTAIRLMSEIVKSKMKDQTLPEIEKISNSANELLNKMNTIIWTMTSSNDTVENLVAYIRSFAVEFFENTSIECYFTLPPGIPQREISGEKRRNIFLSVKEALNNVLKHSQSSVVKINVSVTDRLVIEIQDDGIGINLDRLRKFGNGLNNMKKRMASIDGECTIENWKGTRTTFYLQL